MGLANMALLAPGDRRNDVNAVIGLEQLMGVPGVGDELQIHRSSKGRPGLQPQDSVGQCGAVRQLVRLLVDKNLHGLEAPAFWMDKENVPAKGDAWIWNNSITTSSMAGAIMKP